jgi:amidase
VSTQAPWTLDATEIARRVQQGDLAPDAAADSCRARANALKPYLNAITLTPPEPAAAPAGRALDGVPVVTNENTDQRGAATTLGIAALRDNVAKEDAPLVRALRDDGAVFIGRGHTPDFSLRFDPDSSLHGRVVNPRYPALTAGGSSGGSAVAVASGMAPIAHGNDLGGSVRYPAYCCGVLGLKFSAGRGPAYNPSLAAERPMLLDSMAQQGAFARSTADLALAAMTMMRGSRLDPWSLDAVPPPATARDARPVAVLAAGGAEVWASAVADSLDRAAAALAARGVAVARIAAPDMSDVVQTWGRMLFAEVRALQVEAVRRHGGAEVNRVMDSYLEIFPAVETGELLRLMAHRSAVARRWTRLFERFRAVLAPVFTALPPPPGTDLAGTDAVAALVDAARFAIIGNLAGLPGLSLPIPGLGPGPAAVQILGPRFADERILELAALIEAELGRLPIAETAPPR